MQQTDPRKVPLRRVLPIVLTMAFVGALALWVVTIQRRRPPPQPRQPVSDSGFAMVVNLLRPWKDPTSLPEVRAAFDRIGFRGQTQINAQLLIQSSSPRERAFSTMSKGLLNLYEGEPVKAYDDLTAARAIAESDHVFAGESLSTLVFLQGVAGLRRGETENCILCRGEGSCVFPIRRSAIHTRPDGSRLAVRHFSEYLRRHPDDLGVQWLLNLAHMTLGEHPDQVPPEFLLPLAEFVADEKHSIGEFRDIGHLLGVNRLNQAGGAIMDDFDNDEQLDLIVSSMDPALPLALYRNVGDGTFAESIKPAGFSAQLGGLHCVQTDYNNDGRLDVFVIRGAWFRTPVRPSLLRNDGGGKFTDVTREAGLLDPINAITAQWADYDNDGHLDLFIGADIGPNRLFHNDGRGVFTDVAKQAGVAGDDHLCRGASWGDFDGDGYADLFVNHLRGPPQLFHNQRNGRFDDVSRQVGVTEPTRGFSCWFWDFDNDGWLDIFASSYDFTLNDVLRGMLGRPHELQAGRLFRNDGGKRFIDVTREVGLDRVFAPMGSNFADFDNDGWLDFYLGTGEPSYSTLIPNFLFRNIEGRRFADITLPSRTGHLQKGHGVACGDWDRDGNVDLFVQLGGATPGDCFHNAMFQNPGGHENHWLNLKLIGKKTNRAAIGARIKVVLAQPQPRTIYRHVDSGSSFGANPLEQMIGIGKSERIEELEISWPTSGAKQTFRDVDVDQSLEVTEEETTFRRREYRRIQLPRIPGP